MNSGDCFASEETLTGVFDKERKADILYGYVTNRVINGEFHHSSLMKQVVCWYDLFLYTIPHQGAFIRKTMFTIVGLYEEKCKIVADWKWFVVAILIHKASYEFIPYKIAVMQEVGISNTAACLLERQQQMKGVFPSYISEDDAHNLTVLSIIQSTKFTRYLFKIVKIIAFQIHFIRKKLVIRYLTPQ